VTTTHTITKSRAAPAAAEPMMIMSVISLGGGGLGVVTLPLSGLAVMFSVVLNICKTQRNKSVLGDGRIAKKLTLALTLAHF